MLILLHGDNLEASRAELNRLKAAAKGKEIRQPEGRLLDTTTLTQALESMSLFGRETLVIIENLFGKLGRKTKLIEELAAVINRSGNVDIVLWEDKELGAAVLKSLNRPQIRLFKLPVLIFRFLDNLKPGSAKFVIALFQKLVEVEPPEQVLFMTVKRLRQLIMLRDGTVPEGLQGWQLSRLTSQAKSFTMVKLISMYKKLLEIEYSTKTGSTPFNLTQQIEQFLLDL